MKHNARSKWTNLTAAPAALLLAVTLLSQSAVAATGAPAQAKPLEQVSLQQRLGERVPLDLPFIDERGNPITLRDCISDRPAVLVLAYYRCPMLCGLVLNGLTRALSEVPLDTGDDFQVIVVSIDPSESPAAARRAKMNLLKAYDRGDGDGWHLLTGRQEHIEQLAAAVGFHYAYDERTDQFAHPSGIMLLSPDGVLRRYFYGFDYDPGRLTDAITDAGQGKTGATVTEVLLTCFLYDPTTGKYGLTIISALRLGGVMTIAALGLFIWRAGRRGNGSDPRGRSHAEGGP